MFAVTEMTNAYSRWNARNCCQAFGHVSRVVGVGFRGEVVNDGGSSRKHPMVAIHLHVLSSLPVMATRAAR
jgi:hypothetical protein